MHRADTRRFLALGLICASLASLSLTSCSPDTSAPWLGYAEADYIYVAAPSAGWITSLAVERGATVAHGQTLFTLDADSQTATRNEAAATIAQAEQQRKSARASLELAEKQLARQKALLASGGTTKQAYDEARQVRDSAAAALQQYSAMASQYRASLAGASYQLSQRQISSRVAGRVEDIYFRPGEYTSAAAPVIVVLPPDHVFVRFFVPEKQFAKLHQGQKVAISCDGCGTAIATVTFVASSYEYAPPVVFTVKSRDKLVYKAEARAPGGLKLHPGQPVDVHPL
ncbi:MAG: efflux RND transporter periplasmic adaptor subunit [Rhizomicrobium sp.]